MPQLTPTLIQGSDKANQINEKVMLIVDALWGFLAPVADSGLPHQVPVNVTDALCDYYTDTLDAGHFSNVRTVGTPDDNGLRIFDTDNDEEIRIRLDGEGELNGGGEDIPTLIVEVRTDGGGLDVVNASRSYTTLVELNKEGMYLHSPDYTGGSNAVTGLEMMERFEFIADEIDDIRTTIAGGGISIDGENGIGTYTSDPGGVNETLNIHLDTTDLAGNKTEPEYEGDVIVSSDSPTGFSWARQTDTDTIYVPVYASASYYATSLANGNVTWTQRFENHSSGSWTAGGQAITVPLAGWYTVSFTVMLRDTAGTAANTLELTASVGGEVEAYKHTVDANEYETVTISIAAAMTSSSTISLAFSYGGANFDNSKAELTIQRMSTE